MRKKLTAGFVLVALATVVAATAGAESGSPDAARSAGAAALPTLTLALDGSSIVVGGTLQSGAVDVAITTTGDAPLNPILIHLNPGVTASQLDPVINNPATDINDLAPYGQLVMDANADPGATHVQVNLPAGDYVALDVAGSNPAAQPRASFTIAQAAQPAPLPTPQATVRSIDFGFKAPATLHNGDVVRVQNDGYLAHMFITAQAKNTSDAQKIVRLLKAGKDNKAFALTIGGGALAGPLSAKQGQQFELNVKPGIYVLACFLGTQDGREHTRLGMARIFRVTG